MNARKRPEVEVVCDCPRFERARKFVNHTLACLVARRGSMSMDEYYGPVSQEPAR